MSRLHAKHLLLLGAAVLACCAAPGPPSSLPPGRPEPERVLPARVGEQPAIVVLQLGPGGAQILVGATDEGPVALPASRWLAEVSCKADDGLAVLEVLAAARPHALALHVDTTGTFQAHPVPTRPPARLIEALAGLAPELEELHLEGPWEVGPQDLVTLGGLTRLRKLRLGVLHLLPGALVSLAHLPAFRELNLEPTLQVHPEAWGDLTQLQGLESLSAAGVPAWISFGDPTPKISDTELALIVASAPGLRELDLSHSPRVLTEAGLSHLSELHHLETLRMDDCGELSPGNLRPLRDLPLRELSLAGAFERASQVDQACLDEIGRLSGIRVLRLGSCGESEWAWLPRLGGLEVLDLGHLELTNQGVGFLEELPHLRELTTRLSAELDRQGLLRLAALPALRHLTIAEGWAPEDAPAPDDAFLARLANGRRLETLDLFDVCADYGDEGFTALASCGNLRELRLHAPAIGSAGVKALSGLPHLRTLWLRGRFVVRDLAPLRAAPALRALWLEGPRLTYEGVRRELSGLRLTSIEVFGPDDENCSRCSR